MYRSRPWPKPPSTPIAKWGSPCAAAISAKAWRASWRNGRRGLPESELLPKPVFAQVGFARACLLNEPAFAEEGYGEAAFAHFATIGQGVACPAGARGAGGGRWEPAGSDRR